MVRIPKIEEPKFDGTLSGLQLISSLNWYHSNKESKDAVSYIQDYCKKNKISGKVNTSKNFLTVAWLCRLSANGNTLEKSSLEYIKKTLPEIMQIEKVVVIDAPVVNVQDRMKEKVAEIAGDLEGAIDDFILNGCKDGKSPFSFMQNRTKGMHASRLIDIFKRRRQEFDEVLNTKDSELKEGYSNFTKPQLKRLVAYCDDIITDAMKIAGEAKAIRKPRKRKVKTVDQLVSKLNYLDKSPEYKLQSIAPKQIIGAMQLWVFNVKTKKLGVYHADDAGGFGIKGSTLLNYSESKSTSKALRKPMAVLPEILKGGKVTLRNCLGNLTTKESPLTGRLNKDTILLRVL